MGAFLALVTRGAGRLAKAGGGARKANQLDTDSSPTRRSKPRGVQGVKFDGTGYRYSDPQYTDTSFDTGAWNANSNHRYSGEGEMAVYAGTSRRTAGAEVSAYGPLDGKVLVKSEISLKNALDLTDQKVRASLNISLEDILQTRGAEKYSLTQDIARWARRNGFDGIIAPSARDLGGSNVVVFK